MLHDAKVLWKKTIAWGFVVFATGKSISLVALGDLHANKDQPWWIRDDVLETLKHLLADSACIP